MRALLKRVAVDKVVFYLQQRPVLSSVKSSVGGIENDEKSFH